MAQRTLSTDAALGLPLPRPTRCLESDTGRPARLMSATSLKFIAPGITADATSQSEFDRYLAAPAAEARDAMQWWEANAHRYRNTARLAKQYFSIPAISALSEQRFSAARRFISKLRSQLDPDRVDTIIFLYKNL